MDIDTDLYARFNASVAKWEKERKSAWVVCKKHVGDIIKN